MTKTLCVGGSYYSESINYIVYDELNAKTQKLFEIIEELVIFVDKPNLKYLLNI